MQTPKGYTMGKVIAFANQKGGIGKTTSAVNIAAAIAARGKKVLAIDCDPQGNLTSSFGINKKSLRTTTYELLLGSAKPVDAVIVTPFKNVSVIPSNISLAGAEVELVAFDDRATRLKKITDELKPSYDYIILDSPPSLGILTIDALTAADGVVIPMQCEYFALEGISQMMLSIRRIKELYNRDLQITGILLTMFNPRLNLTYDVLRELKKAYADKILSETIPRSVRLSEAPSHGMPICYYDKNGKGAEAYERAAKEIMKRI